MQVFSIMKDPGRGTATDRHRTARKILVRWDDGNDQETVGIPDAVEDGDVADFITKGWHRRVMGWTEVVPRDNTPQRPPD